MAYTESTEVPMSKHDMHESDEMNVMERIAHNTEKTAEYQSNTEEKLDAIKHHIKRMKGGNDMSEVAEIIAARDRGDMGRGTDGLLGGGGIGGGLIGGMIGGRLFGDNDRRGNDCGTTAAQVALTTMASDFNAAQQSAILGAIQSGTIATIAASNNNAEMQSQHNSDMANCAGFLQTTKNFGDLGQFLAGQFTNLGNNVTNEARGVNANINGLQIDLCGAVAGINANINQGQAAAAISELRTQAQIADVKYDNALLAKDAAMQAMECCCEIKEQAEANKNAILQQMCADREADAARREQDLKFEILELKRCRDNDSLSNTIVNFGSMVDVLTKTVASVKAA